jgi:hypothetical protein
MPVYDDLVQLITTAGGAGGRGEDEESILHQLDVLITQVQESLQSSSKADEKTAVDANQDVETDIQRLSEQLMEALNKIQAYRDEAVEQVKIERELATNAVSAKSSDALGAIVDSLSNGLAAIRHAVSDALKARSSEGYSSSDQRIR